MTHRIPVLITLLVEADDCTEAEHAAFDFLDDLGPDAVSLEYGMGPTTICQGHQPPAPYIVTSKPGHTPFSRPATLEQARRDAATARGRGLNGRIYNALDGTEVS